MVQFVIEIVSKKKKNISAINWNFIVLANFSFRYLLEWSETGNRTIYVHRARFGSRA